MIDRRDLSGLPCPWKMMSEEKPTFKVTDRRLFNPDGSPRDIAPEAASPAPPPPDAAPPVAHNTAQASASAPPPPRATATQSAPPEPPPAPAPTPERRESAMPEPDTMLGGDPTQFANLVMFIASPAAAALGMTEHPGLPAGEVDLPLAKHCIDLLATVQQKTHGNLSAQEGQILEGLLAELRMQYVSLAGTRTPPVPRGFSGGDITGGR